MSAYFDERGRAITLGPRLGKGGEASIFRVAGTPWAAKIYSGLSAADLAAKYAKLRAMLANRPDDPTTDHNHVSIAWPAAILRDEKQALAGYLMPSVETIGTLRDINNPAARRLKGLAGFTSLYLHRAASNVCYAVAAVHDVGHVIGDLNPNNVLINRKSLATLIDTDSYQIWDHSRPVFPCGVGVPEYMAPERAKGGRVLTPDQDYFALAILLFELLMGGFHPYAGGAVVAAQSTAQLTTCEYLKQGLFPFVTNAFASPPDGAPAFDLLHRELRDAFMRTFLYGHATPHLRPRPREWAALIRRAEDDLQRCHRDDQHFYYGSVGTCLWCEQSDRAARLAVSQRPRRAAAPTQRPIVTPPRVSPVAPPPAAPPGLQPLKSSSGGAGIVVVVLALVGLLTWWSITPANDANVKQRSPDIQTENTAQSPNESEGERRIRTAQAEAMERRAEAAAALERSRVAEGLLGEWAIATSRLTISRDGEQLTAMYTFPDSGPLSRGEAHQRMRGVLTPNNELKLTNIHHGKIANPLDYFTGDFDGISFISLSPDSTSVTARLSDGRTKVLTRVSKVEAQQTRDDQSQREARNSTGEAQPEDATQRSEVGVSAVRVDRSAKPDYSSIRIQNRGVSPLDPDLENSGPSQFDVSELETRVNARERRFVYDDLKASGDLARCLNLQDLEAIKKRGPKFFLKYFGNMVGDRRLYAWKSVVDVDAVPFMTLPQFPSQRSRREQFLMIPFLAYSTYFSDGHVEIRWVEFNQGWAYYDMQTPIFLFEE